MTSDETFQEIMTLHGKDVWNLAFSLTRRVDVADDVTQDVFLKVYEKLDSYRAEASLKTWLLRITRNRVYDLRRSFFLRRVTLVDFFVEKGNHPSAELQALDRYVHDTTWASVLKLPLKYREVLILNAHHGLSIAEISDLLRVGESTVKSRLYRARKKAHESLKEADPDGEF
jgi:RNA polymerase sigma factor (sigma-70 family)